MRSMAITKSLMGQNWKYEKEWTKKKASDEFNWGAWALLYSNTLG